jgi:hypothetical protein
MFIGLSSEVHIVDDQDHPQMVGSLCKIEELTYLGSCMMWHMCQIRDIHPIHK